MNLEHGLHSNPPNPSYLVLPLPLQSIQPLQPPPCYHHYQHVVSIEKIFHGGKVLIEPGSDKREIAGEPFCLTVSVEMAILSASDWAGFKEIQGERDDGTPRSLSGNGGSRESTQRQGIDLQAFTHTGPFAAKVRQRSCSIFSMRDHDKAASTLVVYA